MSDDFILGIIPFVIIGAFGMVCYTVSRWNQIVREAKEKAKGCDQLRDIKPLTDRGLIFDDLVDYCAALANMEKLLAQGKINVNAHALAAGGNGAISMISLRLLFKRHPVLSSVTAMVFLPIPIGWFAIIIFVGVAWFKSQQAAQFQVMVRDALHSKPGGEPSEDTADKIAKLHTLLKAGALNQAEFDEEKKRILGKAA